MEIFTHILQGYIVDTGVIIPSATEVRWIWVRLVDVKPIGPLGNLNEILDM